MEIFNIIAFVIGVVGIVIISWGALMACAEFLHIEYQRFRGVDIGRKREFLRHHLGSYILIGLEFMIASDIVSTIIRPEIKGLIVLGSIVVIRTIISYSLNKELKDYHT